VAGASIDLDEVQAQVEALRLKIIALSNQSVLGAATEVSTGVCGSKLSDGGYSDGLAETAKLRAQFCPPDQDGADALMTTGSRFNRAALSTDLDWVNTRIAKQD
jgi:hypothetical protein